VECKEQVEIEEYQWGRGFFVVGQFSKVLYHPTKKSEVWWSVLVTVD
jgi:hypothetical protein